MDYSIEHDPIIEEDACDTPSADMDPNVVMNADGRFCCGLCAQLFKNRLNCLNHLQLVHGMDVHIPEDAEKKEGYDCSVCGATFKRKKNLSKHVQSSHNLEPHESEEETEGPFTCSYCDVPFTSISNLNRHCRTKHFGQKTERSRPGTSQLTTCPMCNQKFSNEASLQCHTRVYHKIVVVSSGSNHNRKLRRKFDLFSCNICNLKLNKRFNMNRHVIAKHGVQPSDESISLSEIYTHQENKEASNIFYCQDCNENFSEESLWETHMKDIHNLQPETCCSICGDHSFLYMKDLQNHLQDVHNVFPPQIDEDRQLVRLHKSTLGLKDVEMHALSKIPEWLVKRANGQLVVAVYRS